MILKMYTASRWNTNKHFFLTDQFLETSPDENTTALQLPCAQLETQIVVLSRAAGKLPSQTEGVFGLSLHFVGCAVLGRELYLETHIQLTSVRHGSSSDQCDIRAFGDSGTTSGHAYPILSNYLPGQIKYHAVLLWDQCESLNDTNLTKWCQNLWYKHSN